MGMICSSDFFNYCSDRILEAVPDKVKIVDDGLAQHIEEPGAFSRIREVCKASREGDLTLNAVKLQVAQEVKFAGYIFSADGIKAKPSCPPYMDTLPSKIFRSYAYFLGQLNNLPSMYPT